VERLFIKVGDALNNALIVDKSITNHIGDVRDIIDLRNRLTHGYQTIANDLIWDFTQRDVPILWSEVERLLDSIG